MYLIPCGEDLINILGRLGSDSRGFLLSWSEMLRMCHLHVEGLPVPGRLITVLSMGCRGHVFQDRNRSKHLLFSTLRLAGAPESARPSRGSVWRHSSLPHSKGRSELGQTERAQPRLNGSLFREWNNVCPGLQSCRPSKESRNQITAQNLPICTCWLSIRDKGQTLRQTECHLLAGRPTGHSHSLQQYSPISSQRLAGV